MITNNIPITLAALPFGVIPLALGLWQLYRELSPSNWPQIKGVVVESRSERIRVKQGYNVIPIVAYEFQFNGQTYKSSRRNPGNYSIGNFDAEPILSRFPVGCETTVCVNVKKPVKSVLEYGVTPLSCIGIILGTLITAFAFLPLFVR